ncbi:MAG: glycosyltransferase family 4 protein [Pseudomonadales bacterium]|nr:glycosyltransferase family 4 protein [Pseudomonadales bacterium]
MNSKRIVLVANRGVAIRSSRLKLIEQIINRGYEVIVITADDEHSRYLRSLGVELVVACFDRGGFSICNDIRVFWVMYKAYRHYKPELIHHFHAKPVIMGSIAARLACGRKTKIVNSITGLGHAFISGGWVKRLAGFGYKLALGISDAVIFQNSDDRTLFIDNNWTKEKCSHLIVSSGVDIDKYSFVTFDSRQKKDERLRVLMVGRLLGQKGVIEFIEAAKILKGLYPNVSFEIAGEYDLVHPDGISEEIIQASVDAGAVKYLGYVSNLPKILKEIDVFVLPSYREGVPRAVLEASSNGIPCVGADVPGTREAIVDGKTGFLVEVKNAVALADAIEKLLASSSMREVMGAEARNMVVSQFELGVITGKQVDVYQKVGALI